MTSRSRRSSCRGRGIIGVVLKETMIENVECLDRVHHMSVHCAIDECKSMEPV